MKNINNCRNFHSKEIKQVKKYFDICVGKLQDCISKAKESNDVSLEELNNLRNSITEAVKATNIIYFRNQYPTARDVLDAHRPPGDLLEWHAQFSLQCWKVITKKYAKKKICR